jgi:hypothetical protein
VFLRVGYEFDLIGGQWGSPDEYARAYRYVVDRLRARGVDNTAYVWHSAGAFFRAFDYSGLTGLFGSLDPTDGELDRFLLSLVEGQRALEATLGVDADLLPITDFYPGDGYVDYFGISYWDDACCFGRSSETGRRIYRRRTRQLLAQAQALGLPIIIGESTPAYIGTGSGADSVEWIRRHLNLVKRFDIRATALIVENWPENPMWGSPVWGGFWPDARLHVRRDACRAWVRGTSGRRFVHGRERRHAAPACMRR